MTSQDHTQTVGGVRDLADLLARVEKADASNQWGPIRDAARVLLADDTRGQAIVNQLCDASGFTDAALALCERVLPGRSWDLHFTMGDQPIYASNFVGAREAWAHGPTAPLALLTALLKALIAQAASPGVSDEVPGLPPETPSRIT